MRTEPNGPAAFRVEFDSPAELAAVERASLGVGGLLLPSAAALPPDTLVALTLRVAGGAEVAVSARVVAALPGALALHLEGNPAEFVRGLLAPPPPPAPAPAPAMHEEAVATRPRRRTRTWPRRRRSGSSCAA